VTNPIVAKWIFVAEVAELLMSYQNYIQHKKETDQGYWNSGNSMGKALSLYLAELLYPGIDDGISAWLNDRSISVQTSSGIVHERVNWISATDGYDSHAVSYGCGLLFLYWLVTVKHFAIEDIIAHSWNTFAQLYQNLTGGLDGWQQFHDAVNILYPVSATPNFVWNGSNNIFLLKALPKSHLTK